MKTIITYHQAAPGIDCPDGICSAWIAAKHYGYDNVELVGLVHQNNDGYTEEFKPPFEYKDKNILMLDFCYPQVVMDKISGQANTFVALDHHKDKQVILSSLSNFTRTVFGEYKDNSTDCGATMAWNHFFPDFAEPWFLRDVWSRDTGGKGFYDGDNPSAERVTAAMSARRKGLVGFKAFEVFDALLDASEEDIEQEGIALLEERDRLSQAEVALWIENRQFVEVSGYTVPLLRIVNPGCDRYYSWVGTLLARTYENFFVVIQTTKEPDTYHLRSHSSSKIDLSLIAQANGGGGHFHTAGFQLKV